MTADRTRSPDSATLHPGYGVILYFSWQLPGQWRNQHLQDLQADQREQW